MEVKFLTKFIALYVWCVQFFIASRNYSFMRIVIHGSRYEEGDVELLERSSVNHHPRTDITILTTTMYYELRAWRLLPCSRFNYSALLNRGAAAG